MRIVYIAGATIPSRAAHSIQVMRMASAFAEDDHEVTLIVPALDHDQEEVFGYYGVATRFQIERVARHRFKGGLLLWGIRSALMARRLRPDLVYGRQIHACYFSALFGLPVILEIHRPPSGRISTRLFASLGSFPTLRRVVTNSAALAGILRTEYLIPNQRILAAPNGADKPAPDVSPQDLGGNGRMCVGYIGHLYEGRGVELILELAEACPWADFHLVGGTREDLDLWKPRAIGLNNVTFHGFVSPAAVESYRRGCDVLLAPYQSKVMGSRNRDQVDYMSPLKLFEYMASGKAIVCADLPVLHEVVTDEETALLCNPSRPAEWVEALQRLRDDPDLRRRLGSQASCVFLRDFTRTARARRILQGAAASRM